MTGSPRVGKQSYTHLQVENYDVKSQKNILEAAASINISAARIQPSMVGIGLLYIQETCKIARRCYVVQEFKHIVVGKHGDRVVAYNNAYATSYVTTRRVDCWETSFSSPISLQAFPKNGEHHGKAETATCTPARTCSP